MRILISTDTEGGVWDYTVTLVRELIAAGHAPCVAILGTPDDAMLDALPDEAGRSAAGYRLEWMPGGLEDVEPAARWLRGLASDWRADLIHLNQLAPAAHPLGRPTVVVAHSDVLSWWSEVRGQRAPAEWQAYAAAVGCGLAAADLVVAPSGYQSRLLLAHYGRAADRVIWNGSRRPDPAPAVRSGPPRFLTAGRAWDPAKGMAVLEAALARLADQAPEVHLVGPTSHGDGTCFEPDHLVCHGRVPRHVADGWFDEASAYIAPSLYEPFGLAPLEAALRGCALVLSEIGSFRELWTGCAEFFVPGDAASLASALRRVAGDPNRRAVLADQARERALQWFTAGRMQRAYTRAYAEVLDTVCV